jgi:hypothetical protein
LVLQIGAGVRVLNSGLGWDPSVLNGGVALALLVLAIVFVVEALRAVQGATPDAGNVVPVVGD